MLTHGHGGPGWELGKCLWCPAATRSGQDRYALMRRPIEGDAVFHWVGGVDSSKPRQRYLLGRSTVVQHWQETTEEPPLAGDWSGQPSYYRVNLRDFKQLEDPIRLDQIEQALFDLIMMEIGTSRSKYYPYVRYRDRFRLAQGIYLTKLSPLLGEALFEVFDGSVARPKSNLEDQTSALADARTFSEGQRYWREVNFVRRNPALRKAAVERYGCICAVCRFDFQAAYGELGAGFIEIHHLKPLAEQEDISAGKIVHTTVHDVVPLCSNCHRMVHQERPALSLETLRDIWLSNQAV